LGDGAVAGEFAGGGYVLYHHPSPFSWVLQVEGSSGFTLPSRFHLVPIPARATKALPTPSPGLLTLYRALTLSWHLM
jgi:hypothetical protein